MQAGRAFWPGRATAGRSGIWPSSSAWAVGTRSIPYCSRVCCAYGLRLARLIRHRWPEAKVTTFYMDLQNVGADPKNLRLTPGGKWS